MTKCQVGDCSEEAAWVCINSGLRVCKVHKKPHGPGHKFKRFKHPTPKKGGATRRKAKKPE